MKKKFLTFFKKISLFLFCVLIGSTLGWFIFYIFPKPTDELNISSSKFEETSSFVSSPNMFFLAKKIKELEAEIKELEKSSYERFSQQQDWFERIVNLIKGLMVKVHQLEKMVPSLNNIPILEKEN
ncbi:MAG: hypothetical protein Q8781_00825 [Candidatus Phytoplasma stylosanthis]|uniref:hypothetical protein n=1 Tax=Candidatus Phytoplasma stylosanthis TaxID=2798314 RepID=UPI0029396B5E|nr:hypothetical protein [Candidatus Phytoplasma stylosanthis]MDV3168143.1 hypothetical protein [Candidatus Phytoplasma stylosanthis]MDV3170832.1 hypothetical protein [Candidatus Phytoplasma stylosanthis]MDV3173866.1 hypothetical protein [Candidatus Phytoplasma stylosanthis]MDV3174154.1 hypothetical protein [Candidatus Phytoplasma stylosanthis]MDV3202554.1 hypothetical protein [Candidatus Phytoplasma stylosanthis]